MRNQAIPSFENLKTSFAQLTLLSEDVCWFSSPDFKEIYHINPAYETIWGRARSDLYNQPESWINYLLPEDNCHHHPIIEMAKRVKIEGAQARYHEIYRIFRPNGEVRWILDKGYPIYNESGQCLGVTGKAIDITLEPLIKELHHSSDYINLTYQILPQLIQATNYARKRNIQRKNFHIQYPKGKAQISLREIECILELLKGKTAKQIANKLNLSYRTVEFYINSLKIKFNVHTKIQLIESILKAKLVNNI